MKSLRPFMVVAVTCIMLVWTWRSCPHPIIDFGREIYVPWRISEGDVLYRDLNWFNGPLSPYFNALILRVFGVSLLTLKISNALVTILVGLLVYRLMREMSDCLTAMVGGIAFATIFACGHIIGAANFNFLTPYSHELTHGVALALVMLACLWKGSKRPSVWWFAVAGFALGAVLLTKAELALAAIVGTATALGTVFIPRSRPTASTRYLCIFLICALIPPIIAVGLLWLSMPLSRAVVESAGAWVWLGDPRIAELPFFEWVLGTDRFELNVGKMILWLGRYGLIFVPAALLGVLLRAKRTPLVRAIIALAVAIVVAVPLVWWWPSIPWEGVIRPLPLLLVVIITVLVLHQLNAPSPSPADVLLLSFATFSLALLAKIFFNVHPFHYGFVLSMPGTLVLIAAAVSWVPRWVERGGGFGWIPRAAALAVLGVVIGGHMYTTGRWLAMRQTQVASGPDAFLADDRAILINRALDKLRSEMRAGDTLVVMPEGIMLNYLLRVPSPVRWQNFLPSEMMMYGEDTMLQALKRRPPTFIAVVHRDAKEYDARRFGHDYARRIERWIAQSYKFLDLQGEMPFETDAFGILMLRHKSSATSGPATR